MRPIRGASFLQGGGGPSRRERLVPTFHRQACLRKFVPNATRFDTSSEGLSDLSSDGEMHGGFIFGVGVDPKLRLTSIGESNPASTETTSPDEVSSAFGALVCPSGSRQIIDLCALGYKK